MDGQKRDGWLDALRGIAVLLVLGRHLDLAAPGGELPWLLAIWQRGGWVGVDLFFVLSGFLITGLLFREHQRLGSVDVVRFWVRRGLRIYPAFYLLVLVTWLAYRYYRVPRTSGDALLAEVLFVQNYFGGMWSHTWSLAVEEHFYLALPILLWGTLLSVPYKTGTLRSLSHRPFRLLVPIALLVFIGVPILRCVNAWDVPYRHATNLFPTHLRADALMAGVLLAYVFHYHRRSLERLVANRRWTLTILGACCFLPAFVFELETTWWLSTLGLSLFAFGAVLLIVAGRDVVALRMLGPIGRRSYSIYLWHVPMLVWGLPLCELLLGMQLESSVRILVYLGGSLVLGMLMAWLIEQPVLWLRDRWVPAEKRTPRSASAAFSLFSYRIRSYDNKHDGGAGGSHQSQEVVHDAYADSCGGGRDADRIDRLGDGGGLQGGDGHAEKAPAEGHRE